LHLLFASAEEEMIAIASLASAFRQASAGSARRVRIPAPVFASATSASTRSMATVSLAYDLHEPAKPVADQKTSPIIVMHGLFGSKKNNRTISK
jgi:hypothetical protein